MPRVNPPHPDDEDFPHHKPAGYQYGCREDCCRLAKNREMAAYRRRRGLIDPALPYKPAKRKNRRKGEADA